MAKLRNLFEVTLYSDDELVIAWYWFHWYKGKDQEKFFKAMEQKCIAERASRMIRRGE